MNPKWPAEANQLAHDLLAWPRIELGTTCRYLEQIQPAAKARLELRRAGLRITSPAL